ncbi:hypothetical protein ACFLIM_33365 [Nonomuraea sp. M3C6]|uniref:Uncharacterized protein n=1 Tax=Nonomuraea marmarensis TaxID=3351344 RepID=A0ABW7AL51_9ACTN
MHYSTANEDSRLSFWLRVRKFAVPPSMIDSATACRVTGDWAGACAAAHVDVDLNLRSAARAHGGELAARVRADLRHLAPDLLRWHIPRVAPDGLMRPGLTVSLARYHGDGGTVHLVARTPPAWADAGQRISLALWDGTRSGIGSHPHPRPHRRFRLDLHRHLWDVRRVGELRVRSGADLTPDDRRSAAGLGHDCAVDRWADEAWMLLREEGRAGGAVAVRLGGRRQLVLDLAADGAASGRPAVRITTASARGGGSALPVLPDAATWVLPDLALLRAGLIEADRLHPLVVPALGPGHPPVSAAPAGHPPVGAVRSPGSGDGTRLVECRGAQHRIGFVDGVLVPLDHDPAEIRREELLAALTGAPLPCLQAIGEAHRDPGCLDDVRARLDHGDAAGALAAVEGLLGPGAALPSGALRDELETAARRRIAHGLFRAELSEVGRGPAARPGPRTRGNRAHPRHAKSR